MTDGKFQPEKLHLHEYLLEVKLSAKKHVVVEGARDVVFFEQWAKQESLDTLVTLVRVGSIHVDDPRVLELGLNLGERAESLL